MENNTFHIANFGCRASQSEGAAIQDELLDAGATVAATPFDASVVVVNSCTVTAEADRDVRHLIRRIATRRPEARIIVTGCYAQRAPDELTAMPGVEYVVGNSWVALRSTLSMKTSHQPAAPKSSAAISFLNTIFSLAHTPDPAAAPVR
jgi:tRNA A37 methylthiotransferase MiaB